MDARGEAAKREQGRFYTEANPFRSRQFRDWARQAGLPGATVLEPFAGSNNLVRMLEECGLCSSHSSYDLVPAAPGVRQADTIGSFPRGHDVCVTNPPWLARNSATRNGLAFPETAHDDLYKHCLGLCLDHCRHVAAIVPATFLQARLFLDRLRSYTLLHARMFADTENPVCLALFGDPTDRTEIYHDGEFVGDLDTLLGLIPSARRDRRVRFNDPDGRLGFVAFDSVREASIRFCDARELGEHPVKHSDRFFARISGDFGDRLPGLVDDLNGRVAEFRERTHDVFLTPFKGIRKDGRYRRRMSFALARRFINAC